MSEEKKGRVFGTVVCCIIGFIVGVALTLYLQHNDTKTNMLYLDVGMYNSDIEWMYRFGGFTSEEIKLLQIQAQGMTIEEYHQLLEDTLDGRKEDFIETWSDLGRKTREILNSD